MLPLFLVLLAYEGNGRSSAAEAKQVRDYRDGKKRPSALEARRKPSIPFKHFFIEEVYILRVYIIYFTI